MRKNRIIYRGIFYLRQRFMEVMPRFYAKLFYKSLVNSKRAVLNALTGRASGHEQEYLYARYLASWTEKEEERRKVFKILAEWLHEKKLTYLLDTLSDVILFDRNAVVIATSRPGMWIGKMGSTIDSLKCKLKEEFNEDADVLIKEIKGSAPELRRIVKEIENPWDDYMKCCGSAYSEFMDYLDEFAETENLYKHIDTASAEYNTLEDYKK